MVAWQHQNFFPLRTCFSHLANYGIMAWTSRAIFETDFTERSPVFKKWLVGKERG
jgi:hypothetical protein